jgi:tetraacyldisaccharide 4'-kinase
MNDAAFKSLINGELRGLRGSVLRTVLHGLSFAYSAAVGSRNFAYDHIAALSRHVAVPVVSVGNLTTGGTGKTPVVAMVVQLLQQFGAPPGIVSRGYRAGSSGFNDEKLVLDQQCPGVPHKQDPDRVAAARQLVNSQRVSAIVMDDGFQHRRLHRDLNVVLIDATNPFGFGYLLPRGLLREPVASLRRADVVLLTRFDQVSPAAVDTLGADVLRAVPALADKVFPISFEPTCVMDSHGNATPTSALVGRKVYLMSGIGNPSAFRATCESLQTIVAGEAIFADHHHYTAAELEHVRDDAQRAGAEFVLTTQKDMVKLPHDANAFRAVGIGCRFANPDHARLFRGFLKDLLSNTPKHRQPHADAAHQQSEGLRTP